ncbi:MAG: hypothetical protein WCW52_06595 [Elusimicrobiales bacterium]|jgi:hypothetical protein
MEEENENNGFKIWILLIPVFLLAAWPALKWMKKANSDDLELSTADYSLFNSQEGEVRKAAPAANGAPEFDYSVSGVRYRSKAGTAETERAAAEERNRRKKSAENRGANAAAVRNTADPVKAGKQLSVGSTKGLLTSLVGKVLNDPKTVSALFNNKYVINGFMARGTVKAATGSAQGLANYLKSGGPVNFMNNPVVKAAMNNPGIIRAVATSGMVGAMLNTPAAQALMNDPKALSDLIASNPQLVSLAMSNPNIMNLLTNNPDVSGIIDKFNTSGIKR